MLRLASKGLALFLYLKEIFYINTIFPMIGLFFLKTNKIYFAKVPNENAFLM